VVFKVAKKTFNAIGRLWNSWISQVMKHIRQGSFNCQVRTPEQFVFIPVSTRLFIDCFFLQINFVLLMPLL
jgi:hypothetical protein